MKRLLLFILTALFSLWVSLFWFGEGTIHKVVIYLGYPSIFCAFSLFLWSLRDLHKNELPVKTFLPDKRSAWIGIGLICGLLFLFEPYEFKIVFDEVILSLNGEYLHFDRLSGVPREANDYFSTYMLMDSILDKRPFFFPFLLSLVHDLSGYRISNVFVLNTFLTVLLVILIYIVSKKFAGHRGGLLALLLAGTLPMLSIFATSGHFEILNLVMITVVVLFSIVYLEKPNERRLAPLVLALVLLCQVRYENCLYIFPFGILILLGWKKAGRTILPTAAIFSPVLLILYTIQFRVVNNSPHPFFQEGPNGRIDTFSFSYAKENFISAMNFFFNAGSFQPNSFLLSIFGFSAIAAFCYWALRRYRTLSGKDPKGTTAFYFLLSIGLFSLVILFFNFGMFDRYITHRLSLPIHLLFILLTPFAYRRLGRNFLIWVLIFGLAMAAYTYSGFDRKTILGSGIFLVVLLLAFIPTMLWLWKRASHPRTSLLFVPGIFILTTIMPIGHAHRYSEVYKSNDILMEEIRFIQERKDKEKILFVAGHQFPAMLTKTNTTFIDKLQSYPEVAKKHLQSRYYGSIYISRRMMIDGEGKFKPVEEANYLDPEVFITEEVYWRPLTTQIYLEITRLVDVRMPPEVPDTPENL